MWHEPKVLAEDGGRDAHASDERGDRVHQINEWRVLRAVSKRREQSVRVKHLAE
jgi:hypothetical protein